MKRRGDAGLSLVELMIGLGVGTLVLAGALAVMTEIMSVDSRGQLQSLINQTYFQGVQVALNSHRFSDQNPGAAAALGMTADLRTCLSSNPQFNAASGVPFDCTTLDDTARAVPVPAVIDDALNASFSRSGRCASEQDATCLVKRTTTYNWICPAKTYCSGLRLNLTAGPLAAAPTVSGGTTPTNLKMRTGQVFIPARQLMSKGEISFTCGTGAAPNYALYKLDYVGLSDRGGCSSFDPGPECSGPMTIYGRPAAGNCAPAQAASCALGFNGSGLFASQNAGIDGCTPP